MKAYLAELVRAAPTPVHGRNVAREYLQARILDALQRAGGMIPLAFHGGTALRFLYASPRYSEDLDFVLERVRDQYDFRSFLRAIRADFEAEGYAVTLKVSDQKTVYSAFVRFPGLPYELGLSPHRNEVLAVKKGTDLRGRMTPAVIAALNAAVLNARVVILARKQLEEIVDLLCDRLLGTFKREGEAVVVELSLGLDPMAELRKVIQDVTEQRRQATLELLSSLFGTDRAQGRRKLNVKWRGTNRSGTVQAVETGAGHLPSADEKAEFAVWIAFPCFAGDPAPPKPPRNGVPGAVWIPREADDDLRRQLDNLARILFLTESPAGRAYVAEKYSGEEGRRLTESWTAAAFQLRESLLAGLTGLYSQGKLSASVSIGENPSAGATLQDALKDLGARLLDARFRQHPEFTADVTPQALETLYQALIKEDGRIGPEMGQPHTYAAHYGVPLRIVRPAGTAYALDLGNSPYVQAIEEALKGGDGVRVQDLQERLGREFGLQPFLTDFLVRLTVIFRDLRVMRGRGPLPIEDPGQLSLHGNDLLTPGQRVSHGEWAAFNAFYAAIGASALPDQPSVRQQDAAWASLGQFVNKQASTYTQLRKAVTEAAKPLGGAPRELEQALQQIKAVLDLVDEALDEPTSEAGIRRLTRATPPAQSLPQMLQAAREMASRLQDVEVHDLYRWLQQSESQAAAREAIARYVTGQIPRNELIAALHWSQPGCVWPSGEPLRAHPFSPPGGAEPQPAGAWPAGDGQDLRHPQHLAL